MALANELRIENLVLKNGVPTTLDVELFLELFRYSTPFEPIPLTEEWLLKFGFSDISEDCASKARNFKVFCKSYYVEKCTEQQTIFIYMGSRGWTFKRVGSPLYNYVHELQNLYRWLCGEELTLKES